MIPFLMTDMASWGQFKKQVWQPAQISGSMRALARFFFLRFFGERFPLQSSLIWQGIIEMTPPNMGRNDAADSR